MGKRALVMTLVAGLVLLPMQGKARCLDRGEGRIEKQLAFLERAAEPLSDADLSELRGGYNGLAFRVVFEGFINSDGTQGFIFDANGGVNPTGSAGDPGNSVTVVQGQGDGQVQISATVGGFGGANGVFQVTQIPGSHNVVQSNLFVQLFFMTSEAGELQFSNVFGQ